MSDTSMFRFLLYLNGNPEIKERVEQLERSVTAAMREEADAIAAIAADAGFDPSEWNVRPGVTPPTVVQSSGCCGFMTIGTESIEAVLRA